MKMEIETLKETVSDLNKQLKEINAQVNAVKKTKDVYKKKYHEKEAEYNDLQKLNRDFQVTMIDKTKEIHDMFERLAASQKLVPLGYNFPAIGILRTVDNMKKYHIGNDIWITENEYNGLLSASKTPSQLAGNITTLIFTNEEILTSTKTGYKSRRSGNGKEKCNKFDPIKLAACEAFYKYWLENIYTPVSKRDAKNLHVDMIKYNYYAVKKIADLKKPPSQKKTGNQIKRKNKNKENTENDKESDIESDKENNKESENDGEYDQNEININNTEDEEDDNKGNKDKQDNEDERKDYITEKETNELVIDPLFIDIENDVDDDSYLSDFSPTLSPSSSTINNPEFD